MLPNHTYTKIECKTKGLLESTIKVSGDALKSAVESMKNDRDAPVMAQDINAWHRAFVEYSDPCK